MHEPRKFALEEENRMKKKKDCFNNGRGIVSTAEEMRASRKMRPGRKKALCDYRV